jgi:hypothetical protein
VQRKTVEKANRCSHDHLLNSLCHAQNPLKENLFFRFVPPTKTRAEGCAGARKTTGRRAFGSGEGDHTKRELDVVLAVFRFRHSLAPTPHPSSAATGRSARRPKSDGILRNLTPEKGQPGCGHCVLAPHGGHSTGKKSLHRSARHGTQDVSLGAAAAFSGPRQARFKVSPACIG